MVVRGVYTKAEEKMIADNAQKADALVGWAKGPRRVATVESMKSFAIVPDQWNPLWHDEEYATNTRWGGLVALPTYQQGGFGTMLPLFDAPPEVGYQHFWWIGESWEFFKPVRPGDSLRVWLRRPQSKDVTTLNGKGPRLFARLVQDADHINQNDELVSTIKFYEQRAFLPGPPKPYAMPEYGYTEEEANFIARMIREEEIRGAKLRYWEDVKVGDETKPVVLGPTNIQTCFAVYGAMGTIRREAFLKDPLGIFLPDATTGLLYTHAASHYSDRAAQAVGDPIAYLPGATAKFNMLRIVTNWMGDDGFMRKFAWRHIHRVPIGDTIIGRGKVTNKYIQKGEHLVDLKVWGRDLRGNIAEAGTATVSLFSKKDPYPPVK